MKEFRGCQILTVALVVVTFECITQRGYTLSLSHLFRTNALSVGGKGFLRQNESVQVAISATLLISPSLQHSKQPTTAVIVSHLYIYSQ